LTRSPSTRPSSTVTRGWSTFGRQPRTTVTALLIAATAHAHDAAVDTRHPDDLAGLEDLITVVHT
jgi:hypothetical protein